MRINILPAILILLCSYLPAQDNNEDSGNENLELDDVVVTAEAQNDEVLEDPGHITVISEEDIESSGASDIADVLNSEAGIIIKDYGPAGSEQNISVRGSTKEQVLILLDGQRLNNAQTGGADLSLIPLENIERIEIIRGSEAVLYGADAVGGVINIITKKNPDNDFTFSLTAENGSYLPLSHVKGYALNKTEEDPNFLSLVDTQNISVFLSKDLLENCFTLSGGFTNAGNRFVFKDINNENRIRENTGYISGNTSLSFLIPWDTGSFFISGSYLIDKKEVPGTVTSPSFEAEQKDRQAKALINFKTDHFISNSITMDISNSFSWSYKTYVDPGLSVDSEHRVYSYKGSIIQELLYFNICSIKYGGSGGFDFLDSTDSGDRKRISGAGFLEVPFYFTDVFTLEPAVRFDYFSDFGGALTYKLGAVFMLSSSLSLKANFSKSFRAPGFDDLYWPEDSWAEGNPGLEPETGYNFEIGISLYKNNLQFDSFLFMRFVKDVILWQPGDDDIWRPSNWGEGLYPGLENSLCINFLENFTINVNYSFLYSFALSGDYEFSDNKRLPMLPLHELDLGFNFKNEKNNISATAHYSSLKYLRVSNSAYMPAVFTLDLFYKRKLSKNFSIYFRVDNIFNAQYESVAGYPMPGILLTIGVAMEIER
jgi:outer membrane cobalamin receptor